MIYRPAGYTWRSVRPHWNRTLDSWGLLLSGRLLFTYTVFNRPTSSVNFNSIELRTSNMKGNNKKYKLYRLKQKTNKIGQKKLTYNRENTIEIKYFTTNLNYLMLVAFQCNKYFVNVVHWNPFCDVLLTLKFYKS